MFFDVNRHNHNYILLMIFALFQPNSSQYCSHTILGVRFHLIDFSIFGAYNFVQNVPTENNIILTVALWSTTGENSISFHMQNKIVTQNCSIYGTILSLNRFCSVNKHHQKCSFIFTHSSFSSELSTIIINSNEIISI